MADEQRAADFSRIPDPQAGETAAGAKRVRAFARLSALALMAAGYIIGGENWLIGAFLGGLVVEINLSLLVRTLSRAADWRGKSLRPTLFRFYLSFGATIVVCVLIIRNGWGNSLAFLLGLFSFLIGLGLGLVSLVIKKPAGPS